MKPKDRFISGGPDGEAPTSLSRDVDRLVHKLRTPLNSLSLNADLIGTVSQPKAGKEALYGRALKSLQTEVTRLDTIAGDFQRYVGASIPKPTEVSIAELVTNAVAEASPPEGRKIDVSSKLPSEKVLVDPILVGGAIAELILNGIECSDSSAVKVSAKVDGSSFVIDVVDDGPGIDFDPPDRVFELFMGSKQGHLGFGLTYARRVARIHGGEVTIANSGKEGTTLRLTVPMRPER